MKSGTEFAKKLWGGKPCFCVSMTSPCSLNKTVCISTKRIWQPMIQQAGAPKTAAKSVTPSVLPAVTDCDYKRSDTSLCSTKSWSRIGSLRKCRWFALKYFFGLYFKYFINLKTLELGLALPVALPGYAPGGNRILIEGCRPAQEFVIERTYVHTDSVIQTNQHNFQQAWQFSLHRKSVYCVYR